MALKFCTKCGAELKPTLKFCTKCGTPIRQSLKIIDDKTNTQNQNDSEPINEEYKTLVSTVKKIKRVLSIIFGFLPIVSALFGFICGIFFKEKDALLFDYIGIYRVWFEGHICFFLLIFASVLYFVVILLKKKCKLVKIISLSIALLCSVYLSIFTMIHSDWYPAPNIFIPALITGGLELINLLVSIFVKENKNAKPLNAKFTISFASSSLLATILVVVILIPTIYVPSKQYEQAISLLEFDVDKSIEIFENLNFKDSIKQAYYAKARKAFAHQEYISGIEYMFKASGKVSITYKNGDELYWWPNNLSVNEYELHSPWQHYKIDEENFEEIKTRHIFDGCEIEYKFSDLDFYYSPNSKVYLNFTSPGLEALYFAINDAETPPYITVYGLESGSLTDVGFPKSIRIPQSFLGNDVKSIGNNAFESRSLLESITIPSSIERIESYAFINCISLEAMEFEGTMEQWNSITLAYDWRYNTPLLTGVTCSNGFIPFNN